MKRVLLTFLSTILFAGAFAQTKLINDVTISQIQAVVGPGDDDSPFLDSIVRVQDAVVVTPPKAAVSSSTGGRWIWVYDGTGYLNVRPSCNNNGATPSIWDLDVRDLLVGDTITIIGEVSEFPNSNPKSETQMGILLDFTGVANPNSYQALSYVNNGSAPAPVALDVADLNDGSNNAIPSTGEAFEGTYGFITDVLVVALEASSSSRCQFTVQDVNGNQITVYDRFQVQRPDAGTAYDNTGGTNCSRWLTGLSDFNCPTVGTFYDTIYGIIEGGQGPGYTINPFRDDHYALGNAPVSISNVTRTPLIPMPTMDIDVSFDATTSGPTLDSVRLWYGIGMNPSTYDSVEVPAGGNTNFTLTIPNTAFNAGDTVAYYLEAVTTSGGSKVYFTSPIDASIQNYYVIPRAGQIAMVRDIQTHDLTGTSSIYDGLSITVEGIVTSTLNDLGRFNIQDTTGNVYAGIEVVPAGPSFNALSVGDKVRVTGNVAENFGFTRLEAASLDATLSTATTITPTNVDANLFNTSTFNTEAYEGMLVRFVNPANTSDRLRVVHDRLRFSDYLVSYTTTQPYNDGSTVGGRVKVGAWQNGDVEPGSFNASYFALHYSSGAPAGFDSASMNVPLVLVDTFTTMDYVQGIVNYSFGNFKLMPRDNGDFSNVTTSIRPSIEVADVKVYPNPSNGRFFLESEEGFNNTTVSVVNMLGAEVHNQVINGNQSEVSINNTQPGMYILMLTNNKGELIGRSKISIR